MTAEVTPQPDLASWSFSVEGLVAHPTTWTWEEIHALPGSAYSGDIHCVTTWSKLGVQFSGVSVDTLLGIAGLEPTATHVMAFSSTGYTTNLPLADVTEFMLAEIGRQLAARRLDGAVPLWGYRRGVVRVRRG